MRINTLFITASVAALGFAGAVSAQNQLVVDQIGNSNFSDATQSGNNLTTVVQQLGSANSASVANAGTSSSNDNIAVRQETNTNFAQAGMDGGGSANTTFAVVQRGANNNSVAFALGGTSGNQIGVIQDGGQNTVSGGGAGNAARGFGPGTATFSQTELTMTQYSSEPLTTTEDAPIMGDRNLVAVEQLGFRNVAAISVTGNDNVIAGAGAPLSLGSTQDLALSSEFAGGGALFGTASIDPSGYNVAGFARQDGTDNQAALKQVGDDNTIAWAQIGGGHRQEVTQVGSSNYSAGGQTN